MLSDLGYWMHNRGLDNEAQITQTIRGMSQAERDELRVEFSQILDAEQGEPNPIPSRSNFNFLASSSFRGERCCAHPNCRIKKAPQLFKFAALYADRLFLPFDIGYPGDSSHLLEGSLRMVNRTLSLIDAGIIKPSMGRLDLCQDCYAKLMCAETNLGEKAKKLQRAHVEEFTVSVRITTKRNKKILLGRVSGPREYLETSPMHFEYRRFPQEALHFTEETLLSPDQILDYKILDRVFDYSIRDVVKHQEFAKSESAIYLSDLPSETEFLAAIRDETESEIWQSSVLRYLGHEIPVFDGMAPEELIQIRNEEEFAFRNYRNAVMKAIRVAPSGGDPQRIAKVIWDQQIRPEVEKLQSKANTIRKSFTTALASRIIPTGVIIGVGLLGSKIPASLAHAIDIAASCSLLKDILPPRGESVTTELGSEDFYFLLRAEELLK